MDAMAPVLCQPFSTAVGGRVACAGFQSGWLAAERAPPLGIGSYSTLLCTGRNLVQKSIMDITLKVQGREDLIVAATSSTTILDLKEHIKKSCMIPPSKSIVVNDRTDRLDKKQLLAVHLGQICEDTEAVSTEKKVIQFFVDPRGFPNLNVSARALPKAPPTEAKLYIRVEVRLPWKHTALF
jgi:hypothetical protein